MKRSQSWWVAEGGLIDRRKFLRRGLQVSAATIAATSGVVSAATVGEALPAHMRTLGAADVEYGSPALAEQQVKRRMTPSPPQTAGFSKWHSPIANQRGVITPSGLHFAVHHNGIPNIEAPEHRLMIHGLVERPLQFDLERLERYPMVSRIYFLECSGNTAANALSPTAKNIDCQELSGQVSCSEWTGVPLSTLLREAGVKADARWVVVEGADGGSHARSLPLSKLMEDAFVALYQNGERLRPSQGYPMRLFVPGWEGNVNVKWLHRLEVTDQPAYTKDESGLYSEVLKNGDIERFSFFMGVKSVITHPSGLQRLPAVMGYYEISGLAWSGHAKIARVDVSADGGKTWAQATLHGEVLEKAFTPFSIPWQWNGRSGILMSRATDVNGNVQPTRDAWKQKYAAHSFNHYNAIQAWCVDSDGQVENCYV